jgi:hypothetical protein
MWEYMMHLLILDKIDNVSMRVLPYLPCEDFNFFEK